MNKILIAALAALISTTAIAAPKAAKVKADKVETTVEADVDADTDTKAETVNVYFKNCTAARAAGYSNILRGKPGYAPHLDRDNDGVACEAR
jgi:hypothetical protein